MFDLRKFDKGSSLLFGIDGEYIEYVGSKIMICVVFAFLHTQVRSIYFSGENVVMVTNDRLNLDIVGGCLQPGNVHPMDTKNIFGI